jgi:hypothetical protein
MKEAAEALNGLLGTASGPTTLKTNRTFLPHSLNSALSGYYADFSYSSLLSRLASQPLSLPR